MMEYNARNMEILANGEEGHDPEAPKLTYAEFSQRYVWRPSKERPNRPKVWYPRERGKAIGRIRAIATSQGELYFLRM